MELLTRIVLALLAVVVLLFILAKILGVLVQAFLYLLPSLLVIALIVVAFRVIVGGLLR